MAPVIQSLQAEPWAEVRVLATAQHRHMLDQVLGLFGIVADIDLDIMQSGQSLSTLTARLIERIDQVLSEEAPDMVIAQGDTTTVFAMALCCFYRRSPFAHVEAGLRTFDRRSPFPEEMNRFIAGYLADLHFAPTTRARDNLLKEGVAPAVIDVIKHRKSTAGLDETEATVIEFGRQLFRDHKVTPQLFAKAKALFGPHKLVDLVLLMGNYAGTAALLTAFDMQLPAGHKPLLPIP